MAVHAHGWERRLIDLAHEALEGQIAAALHFTNDDRALSAAYKECDHITKTHSRTFHLASSLLPRDKRRGARALYAFCRVCDNIVDVRSEGANPREELNRWRDQLLDSPQANSDPVALAWADTRTRYRIPWRYAEQLIEGVARDLVSVRYDTFDELADYCYGVASTVGLMAMHIVGFKDTSTIPYAVRLGVALQLTNILRDVGEDWRAGRIYLPQQELAEYGLSEADIAAGQIDDRWRSFMQFQIERTRQLYADAIPGIALLDPDGRFAIAAATDLYRRILDDIELHDYDVFSRRAHLSAWEKIRRLPGIWQLSRQVAQESGGL
jgi:phytoene synthase